jgi:hypothetical protein
MPSKIIEFDVKCLHNWLTENLNNSVIL